MSGALRNFSRMLVLIGILATAVVIIHNIRRRQADAKEAEINAADDDYLEEDLKEIFRNCKEG